MLLQAAAAELAGRGADSDAVLARIRNRWPEWRPAWTVHGMVLHRQGRFEESRTALQTAVALGESGPEIHFYLADTALRSGAPATAEAEIAQALRLAPADPWIKALAAEIALRPSASPRVDPPYLARWFSAGTLR